VGRPDYLWHLLGWASPILLAQWAVFHRLLAANARAVFGAAALVCAWLSLGDHLAIRRGVWTFGRAHLVGLYLGAVPVEEVLFFLLTSLLVTQSLVLFLPRRFKRVPPECAGWRYDGLPL
jgi:lycopene cyclase domain-containing protein